MGLILYISKLSIDHYLFIYLRTYLQEIGSINSNCLILTNFLKKSQDTFARTLHWKTTSSYLVTEVVLRWPVWWASVCIRWDQARFSVQYQTQRQPITMITHHRLSVLWLAEESNAPGHKHSTVAGNVTWSSLNDTHTACSLWTHHCCFVIDHAIVWQFNISLIHSDAVLYP